MKSLAIGFDFDGTLIKGGMDKGIHLMYAAWIACAQTEMKDILHPADLPRDVDRMVRAYLHYPGAPRFQQLAAIVNCLANNKPIAFAKPEEAGLPAQYVAAYGAVRNKYNEVYSSLNDIAATKYWRPFPSAKSTLQELSNSADLYVCSGVTLDILQKDFDHHGFDRSLFLAVWGADPSGGADKAELLRRIKIKGYKDLLFVGDSTKDQEYAHLAGAHFHRIKDDADYGRLLDYIRKGALPNLTQPWTYTPDQIAHYKSKTLKILQAYAAGIPMPLEEISAWAQE